MFLEVCYSLAVAGGLIVLLLLARWKISYGVLSKYGIRGPPPELYYGNTRQILNMSLPVFLDVNLKKYGDIFCYFVGLRPYIVVNDLEIIKQIMVKQFDNFMDRTESAVNIAGVKTEVDKDILQSKGHIWRRQRKILSKTFSTGKLKIMGPIIEESCTSLVNKLEQLVKENRSFNIFNVYGLYTLTVILKAGFGHTVDLISGQEDEFADAICDIFMFTKQGSQAKVLTLCSNFPFMASILVRLIRRSKMGRRIKYIQKKATEIIQDRLQQDDSGNYQDLLQLLIDAKADSDDEEENNIEGAAGNMNDGAYKYRLTEGEIIRNTTVFIAAGYETSQSMLSYTSYLLALHPDKQEKLLEEIDEYFDKNPDASLMKASQNIKYLDMVMQESLRVYPPVYNIERKVVKTTVINGTTFPKDCNIVISPKVIHHSPEVWPEPTVFRPERFTREEKEKRNPMAHMPFGYGPRQCIAMRLALMEVKMALVAILKEYRFVETPDTEKPLKLLHGVTSTPKNGVYLSLEKR